MSRDVWPYPVPSTDVLISEPWQILDSDGAATALATSVPVWDYQMDLELRQSVEIDISRIRKEAALSASTPLQVIAEWNASASQTSGLLARAAIDPLRRVSLSGRLKGVELGGRLTLRTCVTVASETHSPEPFTACRAGEILVMESYEVHLQGDATLFPISVCNFRNAGFDPLARWVLQTPHDPLEPAMGRLRLYLNEDDTELVEAAKRATSPTPTQRRLLDHLHGDITRQLIDLVLLQPSWANALPTSINELESFGASLSLLIDSLFPNESLSSLAARRSQEPGVFAAAIQGALRRVGDAND